MKKFSCSRYLLHPICSLGSFDAEPEIKYCYASSFLKVQKAKVAKLLHLTLCTLACGKFNFGSSLPPEAVARAVAFSFPPTLSPSVHFKSRRWWSPWLRSAALAILKQQHPTQRRPLNKSPLGHTHTLRPPQHPPPLKTKAAFWHNGFSGGGGALFVASPAVRRRKTPLPPIVPPSRGDANKRRRCSKRRRHLHHCRGV